MNLKSLKKEANLIPLLAIVATIAIILGGIFTGPTKPQTDWKAFDSLMNYIGSKKVMENKMFNKATMGIFNDTVAGLNHISGNFFVQSLNNPDYYKEITPEKATPSYLTDYSKKFSIAELPMYFIQHYENKCIYFGNVVQQIDKICANGDHEPILTGKAINKSRGGFLSYRTAFIYYNGIILQGNSSGIYAFKEQTGKIVYHWPHNAAGGNFDDYYFFTKIDDVIIIVDYLKDLISVKAVDPDSFKKIWEREFFYELKTINLEHNSKNVLALIFREKRKSIFIKINSGETILKTNFLVKESSSNGFPTITDSSALVRFGDGAYGKLNFWKDELIWKSTIGTFSFPYHDFIVSKKRERWKTTYEGEKTGPFVTKKFYIINGETGELLKTIKVEGDAPYFTFIGEYIRVENRIYK